MMLHYISFQPCCFCFLLFFSLSLFFLFLLSFSLHSFLRPHEYSAVVADLQIGPGAGGNGSVWYFEKKGKKKKRLEKKSFVHLFIYLLYSLIKCNGSYLAGACRYSTVLQCVSIVEAEHDKTGLPCRMYNK